jgi:hypothetical protein
VDIFVTAIVGREKGLLIDPQFIKLIAFLKLMNLFLPIIASLI